MEMFHLSKLKKCEEHGKMIGLEVEFKQSNVEGEIVNFIQNHVKIIKVLL